MQLSSRYLFYVLLLLGPILAACGSAQSPPDDAEDAARGTTTIYLVRHAEKMAGEDPGLTQAGKERALELGRMMAKRDLSAVYSTNTRRTQSTAEPAAKTSGLNVQDYDAGNLSAFATSLKEQHVGESILVVGHSTTTPSLANALLGEDRLSSFSEDDFGNLLIVKINKKGKAKLTQKRY